MESRKEEEEVCHEDGEVVYCKNPHVASLADDVLYHLFLSSGKHPLEEMFGDVKFVCLGGTPKRMHTFALFMLQEMGIKLPTGTTLDDISFNSNRYSMYKAGPLLSISHGMGMPSISILMHEVLKLLHHARCKNVILMRLGTCGGIGLPPGSLVITEQAVDGLLRPFYELYILGKVVQRPALLDKKVSRELKALADEYYPEFNPAMGKTMCTSDFYEGQGRLDGAFCDYTEEDKLAYLHHLHQAGVTNIEMESLAFASICQHAGVKGAVLCVTLLDRLQGDQVTSDKQTLEEFQSRPQKLASLFIRKKLGMLTES